MPRAWVWRLRVSFSIHQGDALAVLRTLPDSSVHCVITSPPYWGLRDYGTASWEGGNAECDHQQPIAPRSERPRNGLTGGTATVDASIKAGDCRSCGARRVDQQIGLESTPAEYVSKMVEVFQEVRRVLRDDGTLFLNLGDSYAGSWGAQGRQGETGINGRTASYERMIAAAAKKEHRTGSIPEGSGLKPKDLCGIPWRVALALQADGWYWRDCIVWHKPAPMPESVRDRCTKSWEPIFMFAKSERYWFDADAIREPATDTGRVNGRDGRTEETDARPPGSNPRTLARLDYSQSGRNKRNVWTLPPMATPDAHFATFPLELPETCLKAGCPEDGTVLDPFAGAGTTGLACLKQSRNFIGIELNPKYIEIAHNRARKYYPLLIEAGSSKPRLPFTPLLGTAMRDADEAAEQFLIDGEASA
jgi:DNA modification methylase